ncbi:LppU/SCO3897 family protein [Micromonospora sp. CPCC 205561]|uniref:LppU/SCO3897 family protein n=1 Tax=Micromonospora sp. CPCC 205561 TaxID=3122407 RepID=UPI003FA5F88D
MADYGPAGGGHPGPWHGRHPDEPYDPRAGSTGRGAWEEPPPPAHHGPPYASWADGTASPYADGPAPTPGRRRGRGPVVAVLATVAVLLLVGAAAVFHLLGQDEGTPVATPSGSSSPTAGTGTPGAPASAAAPAPSAPAPESSADPRFVRAGQCVRNVGPVDGKPKLLISACAPQTYEVLRRIDEATSGEKDAAAKCAGVDGYTNWYFFDSELDTLDFVLCLKQR